ncbi:hypothetical protein TSUD_42290 [Trifolium subterraneum]|uniref:tRNA pseudouridine synthase n=1 Tax=Trifolium subterraneum TaxID=3900 RepID=A0A2Z6LKY3_TRISU|nr:hypothetical protein TSUD_42290 [Trifolium subterraneum]
MAAQLSDLDYVTSLQARIKELEAENANLLSRLAHCYCSQVDKKLYGPNDKATEVTEQKESNMKLEENGKKKPGYDTKFMSHHNKRYVALKVMYFGKRFYGFSAEAQMEPNVESEIFKALERTRLLIGDKKESQYSRCGRTDKGVSSVGNSHGKWQDRMRHFCRAPQFNMFGLQSENYEHHRPGGGVIALYLRSKLKTSGVNNGNSGEIILEEQLG